MTTWWGSLTELARLAVIAGGLFVASMLAVPVAAWIDSLRQARADRDALKPGPLTGGCPTPSGCPEIERLRLTPADRADIAEDHRHVRLEDL